MDKKTSSNTNDDLWKASKEGDLDKVRGILSHGNVALNTKHGHEGTTALIEACKRKDTAMVKLLIECNAGVNEADTMNGECPLYIACSNNDKETASLLLQNNADANQKSQAGKTCCHIATSEAYEDILKLLLQFNADPDISNNRGNTSLHWAVVYKRTNIVKILLDHGADVNLTNNKGQTAADEANKKGYTEIVDLLTSKQPFFNVSQTKPSSLSIPHPNIPSSRSTDDKSPDDHPKFEQSDSYDDTDSSYKGSPSSDNIAAFTGMSSNESSQSLNKASTMPVVLRQQHSESNLQNKSVQRQPSHPRPMSEPVSSEIDELTQRLNIAGKSPVFRSNSKAEAIKQYIQIRFKDLPTEIIAQPHIDFLFSKGILDLKEKQEIDAEKVPCKQMGLLLDRLLKRPAGYWAESLVESFNEEPATKYIADEFSIGCKAEEIKQYIQRRFKDLLTEIIAQPHIDYLFSKGILDLKIKQEIDAEKVPCKQMRLLLNTLLKWPAQHWAESLVESFREEPATKYIAEELSIPCKGPKVDTLAEIIKENVRINYVKLQEQILADTHIINLYSRNILSDTEKQTLDVEQVENAKVRKFLDMLLHKRADYWAKALIESFSEDVGTEHLVEILKKKIEEKTKDC